MTTQKCIAMVPARAGSERLAFKNLRLLDGKPVIYYAIKAAQDSGVFGEVVVNSESEIFSSVAHRYGARFYLRPRHLGSSNAKSDDVVADFMTTNPGDILVWVNPIAPLQQPEEISRIVTYFRNNDFDSLITVREHQVHCLYDGKPLNFSETGLFAKTQDLTPVQAMVYSLMMWRYDTFLDHYERDGYALLSGNVGYAPVAPESTVIIKRESDLRFAEALIRARETADDAPAYDAVLDQLQE